MGPTPYYIHLLAMADVVNPMHKNNAQKYVGPIFKLPLIFFNLYRFAPVNRNDVVTIASMG